MPSNPKGGCQICRKATETLNLINNNVKKNVKLYAFLFIILIEFLSLKIQNYVSIEFYVYKFYPICTNLEMIIMFIVFMYHSERLRFCQRQKLIILFLLIYYVINLLFLIIPICWSDYQNLINYSILSTLVILFIATWRNL